jgi:hypothetical protein
VSDPEPNWKLSIPGRPSRQRWLAVGTLTVMTVLTAAELVGSHCGFSVWPGRASSVYIATIAAWCIWTAAYLINLLMPVDQKF